MDALLRRLVLEYLGRALEPNDPPWPAYTEHVFRHPCGEWLGLGLHADEVPPVYLTRKRRSLSGAVMLWRLHSGEAGKLAQRCPACGELLVQSPRQQGLF